MENLKELSEQDMTQINGGWGPAVLLIGLLGKLGNDIYDDPSGSVESFMDGFNSTQE